MNTILLFTMGGTEWLLIALVVLLLFGGIKTGYTRKAGYNLTASAKRGNTRIIATVFGGKKIPELMKGLGKGINEFKKGKNESEDKSEEN